MRGGALLRAIGAATLGVLCAAAAGCGGGDSFEYTARFENASQLVKGNEVVIAGTRVGLVEEISLADDGEALIRFSLDEAYGPLRRGTVATARSFSQSGVANRQIELTLPPAAASDGVIEEGEELSQAETVSEVDLDALLNTLDEPTVKDLRRVIDGLGLSYEGVGPQANEGIRYAAPLLSQSRRLIGELTRDEPALVSLLQDADRFSGALADRAPELSALVGNLNATFGALASERQALTDSVSALPDFLRNFNTTAVNLRAALDDLDPLVEASRPVATRLGPFFAELRGASADLVPAITDLDAVVGAPGPRNDLVELTELQVPLAELAVGPVERNGASHDGVFAESAASIENTLPNIAFLRPYTPELLSWMDDFGHSGIFDANGGVGRIAAVFNTFSASTPGFPDVFEPPDTPQEQLGALDDDNLQRCPGSLERDPGDGSTPFIDVYDGVALDCDPSQLPVGP